MELLTVRDNWNRMATDIVKRHYCHFCHRATETGLKPRKVTQGGHSFGCATVPSTYVIPGDDEITRG